jgi:predicted MFS family arabinose efflux permease
MAIGGWLGGVLYDHFATYSVAFVAGITANAVNLLIVGALVFRQRSRRIA